MKYWILVTALMLGCGSSIDSPPSEFANGGNGGTFTPNPESGASEDTTAVATRKLAPPPPVTRPHIPRGCAKYKVRHGQPERCLRTNERAIQFSIQMHRGGKDLSPR